MKIKLLASVLFATILVFAHMASAEEPIWDGNKVVLTSEKLANGVYAYYSSEAKAKERRSFELKI